MSLLHLAGPADMERLLKLVTAFQEEMGFTLRPDQRQAAIEPLLEGSPHGAIWLIGPRKAPVGYLAITFTWSLEFGGLEGCLDEFFIRPTVRKRGMGSEALMAISKALSEAGVQALSLEVAKTDETTIRLYKRARFEPRAHYVTMTKQL
jgi:ribosomal protein S18 acetylase RimI-like enzyme